jgi:response regulator RpfG family c-di-GMP phosphodiesterase
MNEKKSTPDPVSEEIDYSGRPFDYRDANGDTSMVCEHDPVIRQKIGETLQSLNYNVVEANTSKEAFKYMTFHTFNVVVINENFDTEKDGINQVLKDLESLSMPVRRKIFVVLISSTFATMDYMHSLNKSVNLIINTEEISGLGLILKREMEENKYFYHVFNDFQRKFGKLTGI